MDKMNLRELFGLAKKQEEPPERGTDEQRRKIFKRMVELFIRANTVTTVHSYITLSMRELLKVDKLDSIELEQNDIFRASMINSLVNSKISLDELEKMVNKMEEVIKRRP